jgi:hypothetical protein
LLAAVPELEAPSLVAFLDSSAVDGQRFRDRPVRRPEWAGAGADVVLCSSFEHELAQMAVLDGIGVKVVPSHIGPCR